MPGKYSMLEKVRFFAEYYSNPRKEGLEPIKDAEDLCVRILGRLLDFERQAFNDIFREVWLNNPNYVVKIQITCKGRFSRFHEAFIEEFPTTFHPDWLYEEIIKGVEECIDELKELFPNAEFKEG